MKLWRLKIESKSDNEICAVEYFLEKSVVGIGWSVNCKPKTKEDYWQLGEEIYGDSAWCKAVNNFLYKIEIGDLIWTRNSADIYFLGQINGDWEYKNSRKNQSVGVFNIRECKWYKIEFESVPSKVIFSFDINTIITQILDITIIEHSNILLNK